VAVSYERRLAAVLCADVVGYTALMAGDERGTIEALKDSRARVARLTERHGGRVVDTAGDSMLAVFPSAVECVRCAGAIQRELRARNDRSRGRPMELRIGLHLGDLVADGASVYGDGVNIAARLQELSEPSGVCLSHAVLEQVRHHLDLRPECLGPQRVKNVAEPVTAYRVQLPAPAEEAGDDAAAPGQPGVPALFERPALAVLPFDNLTGDPAQEYFADGLCEDLITQLSLLRVLPVMARNSSLRFKNRPVDVKAVGLELGVQYVVEGSVRRAAERIRINAQLIDASTGHHVWADRYDRGLEDLFGLQDEIAERVAASIHQQLAYAEPQRVVRRSRPSLDAWDLAQRAWWHTNRRTRADNARAQELFRAAIARDPEFVWARYGLVVSLSFDVFYQWTSDRQRTGLELFQASQACLRLDANDPHALLATSIGHAILGRREEAIQAAQRAIELSPSLAFAHYLLGFHLSLSGDPERALAAVHRAIWLSPRDPILWVYLAAEASCHFALADYAAVIATCERVLRFRPDFPTAHALLAVSCAHLGRGEEAREHLAAMLAAQPEFTVPGFFASLRGAKPDILERLALGFRLAGLAPERL
jgi:adenylate cyclase